jgi:methyl-accepting chemotaxis protein
VQLTIRVRLIALIALILAFMLALGISAWHALSSTQQGLDSVLLTSRMLRNQVEADMLHDTLRSDVLTALQAGSETDWTHANGGLQEHVRLLRELIATNRKLAYDPQIVTALNDVAPALDAYTQSAIALVAAARTDKAAAQSMLPEFTGKFEALESRMAAVSNCIEQTLNATNGTVQSVIARSKTTTLLTLLAAVLSAIVGAFLIGRAITVGLKHLFDAFASLARGELGRQIEAHSRDEFGQLMLALKNVDQTLGSIVALVRTNAHTVGSAAEDLSAGNDNLNRRTQEQAKALQETASSMEQMSASVKQNAENARQANQLAIGARDLATRGGTIVQRAIGAMNEIHSSSNRIVEIVGVVDEIAFQTNLLALNASVEAARAGEQGRGFAVVASEVRNLAQRSASAAREVKDLIRESAEKVKVGATLVDESGKTIAEILAGVRKVTDIVAEITAASEEQASGVTQVNNAVGQMDYVTRSNAELVKEATAAAKSMAQQINQLVEEVSFFKVRQATDRATSMREPATSLAHDALPTAQAA